MNKTINAKILNVFAISRSPLVVKKGFFLFECLIALQLLICFSGIIFLELAYLTQKINLNTEKIQAAHLAQNCLEEILIKQKPHKKFNGKFSVEINIKDDLNTGFKEVLIKVKNLAREYIFNSGVYFENKT